MLQQFINSKTVSGRLDGKSGGNSAKTVLNIRNMIHAALKQAQINGLVNKNAADFVKAPKQQKKEMRVLTVDEQNALITVANNDKYGCPIVLALYTGMRIGEVLSLKLEDVCLDGEAVIHVRTSIKREYKDSSTADYEVFNDSEDNKTVLRACSESFYARLFGNLLPNSALKSLEIRQVFLRLFALISTKSFPKSAHKKILNRLLCEVRRKPFQASGIFR